MNNDKASNSKDEQAFRDRCNNTAMVDAIVKIEKRQEFMRNARRALQEMPSASLDQRIASIAALLEESKELSPRLAKRVEELFETLVEEPVKTGVNILREQKRSV